MVAPWLRGKGQKPTRMSPPPEPFGDFIQVEEEKQKQKEVEAKLVELEARAKQLEKKALYRQSHHLLTPNVQSVEYLRVIIDGVPFNIRKDVIVQLPGNRIKVHGGRGQLLRSGAAAGDAYVSDDGLFLFIFTGSMWTSVEADTKPPAAKVEEIPEHSDVYPVCSCGCGCEPDGAWHFEEKFCACVSLSCSCVTDTVGHGNMNA